MQKIMPTGVEAELDRSTGETLRITFLADGEEPTSVFFARGQVPSLLALVRSAAKINESPPAEIGSLPVGGLVSVLGWGIRKDGDGQIIITADIRTDDGLRSIPLAFDGPEAQVLAQAIQTQK